MYSEVRLRSFPSEIQRQSERSLSNSAMRQ
jgi:hypothetical protein